MIRYAFVSLYDVVLMLRSVPPPVAGDNAIALTYACDGSSRRAVNSGRVESLPVLRAITVTRISYLQRLAC